MEENLNREDRAILLALERVLAGGPDTWPASDSRPEDEARVCEYVELLGLVPYGLEPAAPSAGVKARLLARIAEPAIGAAATDATATDATPAGATAAHAPAAAEPVVQGWRPLGGATFDDLTFAQPTPAVPVDATLRRVPVVAGAEASDPNPRAEERAPAATPSPATVVSMPTAVPWWTYALAAMLAFCVLGLAFLAGKVRQQSVALARLDARLQVQPARDLSVINADFNDLQRRFHMVTAIAREVYPMKVVEPVGGSGGPTDAKIYVCGNHQRWYLNVQGLTPPPAGKEYHLWFLTERGGPVNGGVLKVRADASSEMDAQSMPAGTKAFAVTLEDAGAAHDDINGQMVLLAEESVSL